MIDVTNAKLTRSQRPGRTGMTVHRATLELYSEVEMENEFGDSPSAIKSMERELKRILQQQIYGQLIDKILVAHKRSLRAAEAVSPSTFSEVQSAFDEIVELIRLHKISYTEPEP